MRTLLVLLPALLDADGGVSGPVSGRPSAYVEARRAFVRPRWKVLARGPELADPTHVTARRGGVLAVADSGWARVTDDGAVKPGAGPARPRLFRLDLH
jgi:hypothetical protein